MKKLFLTSADVAPLAGAWIEIASRMASAFNSSSLPLRERGLKSEVTSADTVAITVAPLAGAWIEILYPSADRTEHSTVAPLAGAWIEILRADIAISLTSVAPLAGAWIEITNISANISLSFSRSPCGSVD